MMIWLKHMIPAIEMMGALWVILRLFSALDRIADVIEKSSENRLAERNTDSEGPITLQDLEIEREQKRLAEKYPGIQAHIHLPALRQ